jgi:hypothetical protein
LSRVPCCFSLKSTIPAAETIQLKPGFAYNADQLAESIILGLGESDPYDRETPLEVLPAEKQAQLKAEQQHWLEVRDNLRLCLRWRSKEGELPDKLGNFRIHVPYFDLPRGASLAFLRPRDEKGHLLLQKIGKGYCYRPKSRAIFSWKGMRLTSTPHNAYAWPVHALHWETQPASIIEIDWATAEAGKIAVNRHQMEPNEKALNALAWLKEQIVEMCRTFLTTTRDSAYSSLNLRLMEKELEEDIKPNWIVVTKNSTTAKARWEELEPPLISILSLMYSFRPETQAKWDSKATAIVCCLGDEDDDEAYDGIAWHPRHAAPDRICSHHRAGLEYPSFSFGLSPAWTERLAKPRPQHAAGLACQFPPQWNGLCGARFGSYGTRNESASIWNAENPIVRASTADAWAWCRNTFGKSLDPLPVKGSLLIEKARVVCWILMCLRNQQIDLWNGLKDRDASFLPTALSLALRQETNSNSQPPLEVVQWVEAPVSSRLRILTATGWNSYEHYKNQSKTAEYLPDPGPHWTILLEDDRNKQIAARPRTQRRLIPSPKKP